MMIQRSSRSMMLLLLLATTLLAVVMMTTSGTTSAAKPAGIKVSLTQLGINSITEKLVPIVARELETTPIADVSGTQHVKVIGDVDYSISNITIRHVDIHGFKVQLAPPNMIKVSEDRVNVQISLQYKIAQKSFPRVSASGNALGTANNALITLGLQITTVDGKPHLNIAHISVDLGNLDVKISGSGASWILDLAASLFKNTIKQQAGAAIKASLEDAINNQINDKIEKTSFIIPIKEAGVEVDFSTVEDPFATETYITYGFKGDSYSIKDPQESPFAPAVMPTEPAFPNTHANVFISDFVAMALGDALMTAGTFNQRITPDMVPASSPIQLNTTSLKFTLPDLYNKYPNRLLQIDTAMDRAPTFKVLPSGVGALLNGTLLVSVIEKDKTIIPALEFALGAAPWIDRVGAVAVDGGKSFNVTGHIQRIGMDGVLKKSYIGDVDGSKLISLLKILINNGIMQQLNNMLGAGINVSLPEGLKVSELQVALAEGYGVVGAKVEYVPTVSPPAFATAQKTDEKEDILLRKLRKHQQLVNRLRQQLSAVRKA